MTPPNLRGEQGVPSVPRIGGLSREKAILIGLVLLAVIGSLAVFYFKSSSPNAGIANPYPPNIGTLALNDPLRDNSNGYFWDEGSDASAGWACGFIDGAYHVKTAVPAQFHFCTATATNFSNFAYEVQMTILNGNCGGITFRTDRNLSEYYFRICTDGSYELFVYTNFTEILARGDISVAEKVENLIAVVANGNTITLYVNNSQIDTVTDNTFSQGKIGLAVDGINSPTEVAFRNARVWTL